MEPWRFVLEEREGGLRLCKCGHVRGFHYARPEYHGGPVTGGDTQCGHCRCMLYEEGDFQGFRVTYAPGNFCE